MWADSYVQLTSIASIDESAEYVLGIDGTGFHKSGTSSWGVCTNSGGGTPLKYKLNKAADGNSFKASTEIGTTTYYLTVPTSNTFTMATSSTANNTDMIIGTTQVSGTNYAVANKGTTARHLRLNGTSGLRSYAGTTGTMAFFYKVVPDGPTVSAISVKTAPTKTTYMEGEKFDPTGLVITKTLSDANTVDVAYSGNEGSFTFNPSLTTELSNETSVSITYGGKTTAQAITVNPFVATAGTYDIVPNNVFWGKSTQDGSTSVTANTTFGPVEKYGVTFEMNSGKSTNSYMKSDHSRAYDGYTLKLTAPSGFNLTAIEFTGSTWAAPTANVGIVNSKKWTGEAGEVTFSFSGTSYMSNIKVTYSTSKALQTVTVSGTPTKTTYTAGESFEPAGLTVTGHYDDNSDETITEGITWSTPAALTAGQTSVGITATVKGVTSAEYTVTGLTVTVPVTLTSIVVSGTPTKTTYLVGDAFETAGLVVTGTYSDSHQEVITEGIDWTVDPEELALGTTSVDVMASVGSIESDVYTVEGLTVTKPEFETVTYTFSSFTSGTSVELTNLDGFTITLNANGGTNPAWSSNQARVYAKGSLTVKANNATIKSIEYTYAVNAGGKNNVTPTIDGVAGTTNAGTWDVENKTWTGADEEVTFTTSGTAGNIGFTKLIIKYAESNKTTPTLSFSATTAEVTIGADDNVFPTLTTDPVDLAGVTYESSNTDVATIDENTGVVTLVAAGETTITARYAGNAEYAAATPASYTLTVVKAPFVPTPVAEGYEVVDFTEIYSTDANVEDYEGTSFAMAFAKPQSSRTPTKYYNNGNAVRAYEGNTITITGAENIKYVDIAWVSSYVDNAVSITGLGTTTAVVTFSKTCRFTKITVSYKGSNSTLVATDGENYYATFSSEKNVVFANATAYTVSVADGKLALTEVKRNKVPAGNAVLLESASANVDYYFVDGDEDFEDNMLVACTETCTCPTVSGTNYYYKLAYGDNTNKTKLGFWWGAEGGSNDFNVKAGGAVLVVPQAVAANLRGFSFGDVTTGINVVETTSRDVIFNLQGQRINRLQQGVNIVNGKKVLR